jgi:organic radical activating enzyme
MTYRVKEMFRTIQGEGIRTGTKAVFIRFVGCNMWSGYEEGRPDGRGACARWCDTDFRKEGSSAMTAEAVAQEASRLWGNAQADQEGTQWVVCTGGEPMLQLDNMLVSALRGAGFNVAVETNGTVEPKCLVDWLCVSPKLTRTGASPVLKVSGADELKIVLGAPVDWSDDQLLAIAKAGKWRHKIVHSLDTGAEAGKPGVLDGASLQRCIEWVMNNAGWRLGFQLHKLIGAE